MPDNPSYTYIIIGSGSAGSVLAARLTEDRNTRVLVLEAGPLDRSLYALRMPAALAVPLESERYNWAYYSQPEPHMDNRRLYYPRGRVVGGSSSINGMVYLRGNPLDYEKWAEVKGLENWSFARCLPYFKKMESCALGPNAFRGAEGPIRTTIPDCDNPLYQAFLQAGQQAGHVLTEDVNGFRQEGVYRMERSTHGGLRSSTSVCYLHPARRRGRIELAVGATVTRILFTGRTAMGVEYLQGGTLKKAYCDGEVILSAGAINSPKILKLSGIGPAPELRGLDIDPLIDLPGVGENLQDHLDYLVQYKCKKPVSIYPATRPVGKLKLGLEWLLFKKGLGASNIWETGSFFRTGDHVESPNLQHHFAPIAISYDGAEKIEGHGFQFHISQMRPKSRGWVRLKSTDPHEAPLIRFNHLAVEEDRQEIRDGIRMTRTFANQAAFDPYRGEEIAPGPAALSDGDLDAFARAKGETSHHPSCTCKMGQDELSVVDAQGRVHEAENLRVVDASIMPTIVTANINATTIMLAEKIADSLRGRPALPPETVAYYRSGPEGTSPSRLDPQ